jgi:hypothetical protein
MARVSAFALSALVLQVACGGSEMTETADGSLVAPGAAPVASSPVPTPGAAAGSGAVATTPSVAAAPTTTAAAPAAAAPAAGAATPAAGAAPTTAGDAMAGAAPAATDTKGGALPAGVIPENCRGFSIEGIKYSPGGDVLPNTCEPFHPTTNNPYAVRCVDVWPFYKTKFPGDQFCILPPPPELGMQYGVHPQGTKWFDQVSAGDLSGYEAQLADDWVMDPGEEEERNFITTAPNTSEKLYYRNSARMRPGSHHMIVTAGGSGGQTEVWAPGAPGFLSGKNVPGAQRPDENNPKTIAKPPEDEGLFMRIPANPNVTFNLHHFNATSDVILKEMWTNMWWEDDTRKEVLDMFGLEFGQTATLQNVAPGDVVDLHYSWSIGSPFRVVQLFGHRHVWTTTFSAWVEDSAGKQTLVYDSMDWFDEPTYRYDSLTKNPEAMPATKQDGAFSGILNIEPGSKLHFNCHIEYTDERAVQEDAPMPATIGNLKFANEAFTAEMCILFGQTTDMMLLAPSADSSPVPDFAKAK